MEEGVKYLQEEVGEGAMMNTERVRGGEKERRRKTGERKEKEEGVGKRQQSRAQPRHSLRPTKIKQVRGPQDEEGEQTVWPQRQTREDANRKGLTVLDMILTKKNNYYM